MDDLYLPSVERMLEDYRELDSVMARRWNFWFEGQVPREWTPPSREVAIGEIGRYLGPRTLGVVALLWVLSNQSLTPWKIQTLIESELLSHGDEWIAAIRAIDQALDQTTRSPPVPAHEMKFSLDYRVACLLIDSAPTDASPRDTGSKAETLESVSRRLGTEAVVIFALIKSLSSRAADAPPLSNVQFHHLVRAITTTESELVRLLSSSGQ